jgi:hypothetical protein
VTAIFALWNTGGFSLAADSNQRINEPGQIWIDPIQKIFPLSNHQVAFGGAGDSLIDLVDVNVLISTWSKKLKNPLPTIEDYAISFLNWFNDQKLPDTSADLDIDEFDSTIKENFEILKTEFPQFMAASSEEITDFLVGKWAKQSVSALNVYGNRYLDLEINNFEYESDSEVLSYESISRIHNEVTDYRVKSDSYKTYWANCYTQCFARAAEIFPNIVGEEFDSEKEWHIGLIDSLVEVHENLFFPDATYARCMLIGYGENDWIPRAIVFRIYDSEWGVRQVAVEQVLDPRFQWYVTIGISSGVGDLARGYSSDFHESLIEVSSESLDESTNSELMSKLYELGTQRIQNSLKRIDSLTVRRLEFVARLFVELEALKSYLNEPLPGVGGDVQYITMTKDSTKSGVYHEYN